MIKIVFYIMALAASILYLQIKNSNNQNNYKCEDKLADDTIELKNIITKESEMDCDTNQVLHADEE
jgi:hypothetical protein